MFVNGMAYAVILLPALAILFFGALIFAIVFINRRYPPFGWFVPMAAAVLIWGWYERDRNGPANPDSKGVVEFRISDSIEDVVTKSTFKFNQAAIGLNRDLSTGEVVDIRFDTGNGIIDFPKVGGLSNSLLDITFREPGGVAYVTFGAQYNPLKLERALARAREIEGRLLKAGFVSQDQGPRCQRFQPIERISHGQVQPIKTWVEADTALRDARVGITAMKLACLIGKTATVSLKLENWARGHSSIYSHNFGREWGLVVEIES